ELSSAPVRSSARIRTEGQAISCSRARRRKTPTQIVAPAKAGLDGACGNIFAAERALIAAGHECGDGFGIVDAGRPRLGTPGKGSDLNMTYRPADSPEALKRLAMSAFDV